MNRRGFLARGIVTAPWLSGCLSPPAGGRTPTPRPTVAVVDRDGPPDIPARPTVEVVQSAATDAAPPVLRATVENTAEHPIEVGEERAVVFAFVQSQQRPGLVLLPTDEGEYASVEPGCWRLEDDIAVPEYYGVVSLTPGEATERELGVWATPDGDGCLPTGQFRFESRYAGAQDRSEDIEEEEWAADWGFTLAVE